LFCKKVEQHAKKMNLDLTTCRTLADVTSLPSRPDFDVAILDYYFGTELTAFQVSHLFSKEIPVVLVSNTEGRKISGDTWPHEIRSFVHKSAGIDAILTEALITAHWGHLVPKVEPKPERSLDHWWVPVVVFLGMALGATLAYFWSTTNSFKIVSNDKEVVCVSI